MTRLGGWPSPGLVWKTLLQTAQASDLRLPSKAQSLLLCSECTKGSTDLAVNPQTKRADSPFFGSSVRALGQSGRCAIHTVGPLYGRSDLAVLFEKQRQFRFDCAVKLGLGDFAMCLPNPDRSISITETFRVGDQRPLPGSTYSDTDGPFSLT